MDADIRHRPSFALAAITLEPGDGLRAEAGAMVSHDAGVAMETAAQGGFLSSLKRSVLGDESFFVNTFTAEERGEVTLAPALPGDIVQHELGDGSGPETLYVQSGSFLAASDDIELDTEFGGGRSFFGGEGLFLLRLEGAGDVFVSSYGAIDTVDLAEGEEYTVDTGHIVAFEDTASFDVERIGGLKSTLFSGEGLVCRFRGPGRVWLQTRSQEAFLNWLIPKLPQPSSQS